MRKRNQPGQIIILNGAPRSGKSSIARVIISSFDGDWVNPGVDQMMREETPESMLPGIGLRPGENRPDLEDFIVSSYRALYENIATQSRDGINVVVDVGHHDLYSKPLNILPACMKQLSDLPVMLVGVRCDLEDILARRATSREDYLSDVKPDQRNSPVHLWQEAVHVPGIYDLVVDTSRFTSLECAKRIKERMKSNQPNVAAIQLAKL